MMNTNESVQACPKCQAPIPADAPGGLCPKCVFAGLTAESQANAQPQEASEPPAIEALRQAFPQLEIVELIGRGGMGFVYKARQPHLDRWVALKLLPEKLAKDPQFTERFNREGRVLAKLNHPNIVSIHDFGKTSEYYFLLMEYVDGVNMRQAMQTGRFSPQEALHIVPKICEALQYAHEQGVLHRDIKPENILLDAKGRVKIADFGIAKLIGDTRPAVTLTGTGAALGTLHYMAPEQLETPGKVDHRADIYSLGVVFYEMLTGELPLGRFEPPSAKTPVDASVDGVVFRTLEKDREKRFQSAEEVKTQVENLKATGDAPSGATRVPPFDSQGTAVIESKLSIKAIVGAGLTGLGLILAVLPIAIAVLAGGGIGIWEIIICITPGLLFGLVGTILGWVALSDIRSAAGTLRGLPLAVFAALCWPLMTLLAVTLAVPTFVTFQGPPPLMVRIMALVIPAGVLTFCIWAVYTTSRWAANKPPSRQRGVLKWIFLAALIGGVFYLLVSLINSKQQRVTGAARSGPDLHMGSEQIPAPDGMVGNVTLLRIDRFRFQVRPNRWTEFQNLCLKPNRSP